MDNNLELNNNLMVENSTGIITAENQNSFLESTLGQVVNTRIKLRTKGDIARYSRRSDN